MNGKLLNRIPLIKKLKWREYVAIKGVWGDLTSKNDPSKNINDCLLYTSRTEHPLVFDVVNIVIAVEVHYQSTHHGIVLEVNHTRHTVEAVSYTHLGTGVNFAN